MDSVRLVSTRLPTASRPSGRKGGQRETGGGDSGVVFLLDQTDRKWIIRGAGPPRAAAAAQGLAGGLGEGQEPWESKLAVLVFHCGGHGDRDR